MRYGGRRSMRAPAKLTSPRAGGTRPMIAFMAVDLPAPLRPSSATTSPAFASSDTPWRIGAHFGRQAAGDQAAAIEHDQPIGLAEHDVHVVLGEQHGDLLGARQARR